MQVHINHLSVQWDYGGKLVEGHGIGLGGGGRGAAQVWVCWIHSSPQWNDEPTWSVIPMYSCVSMCVGSRLISLLLLLTWEKPSRSAPSSSLLFCLLHSLPSITVFFYQPLWSWASQTPLSCLSHRVGPVSCPSRCPTRLSACSPLSLLALNPLVQLRLLIACHSIAMLITLFLSFSTSNTQKRRIAFCFCINQILLRGLVQWFDGQSVHCKCIVWLCVHFHKSTYLWLSTWRNIIQKWTYRLQHIFPHPIAHRFSQKLSVFWNMINGWKNDSFFQE